MSNATDAAYKQSVISAAEPPLIRLTQALVRQAERIATEDFHSAIPEMESFVIEIARLASVAKVLADIGLEVDPLLEEFDASTPNARLARNVFSHYDEYLLGHGRLQPQKGVPMTTYFARGATAGTAIHMSNPDIVVNVGDAIGAASNLANGLLDLIELSRDTEPR